MSKKVVQFKKKDNADRGMKMSTAVKMKPIQATPELIGNDVARFIEQVFTQPSKKEVQKNTKLLSILQRIQK